MPATGTIAKAYASARLYRAVVGKSDPGDDEAIDRDLLAMSRYLDQRLGRFFTCDDTPQARIYPVPGGLRLMGQLPVGWAESENPFRWGPWSRHLTVDDMAYPPVSVIVDDNYSGIFTDDVPLVLDTDVEFWPPNAQSGPEWAPYEMLVLPVRSGRIGFLSGQRVQVVARWGWPAIPAAIERATCQLVGILRLESPRATSRVTEVGQVVGTSKVAQDIVQSLLSVYQRKSSIV